MKAIELSERQIGILRDLEKRGAVSRAEYADADLEALLRARAIRDLHPARVGITAMGLEYLRPGQVMPADTETLPPTPKGADFKPLSPLARGTLATIHAAGDEIATSKLDGRAVRSLLSQGLIQQGAGQTVKLTPSGLKRLPIRVPPQPPPRPPQPPARADEDDPAQRNTLPVANGKVSPAAKRVLERVADSGGEMHAGLLNTTIVHKLLVEKLVERSGDTHVAITPDGVVWLEANRTAHQIEPSSPREPSPEPTAPAPAEESLKPSSSMQLAVESATQTPPTGIQTVPDVQTDVSLDDEDALKARTLDLLMAHSPAVRDAYDHMAGLQNAVNRMKGV